MQLGFIFILIASIFISVFAIQNGTIVKVDLFFVEQPMPLAVIILACFALGAVIAIALGAIRQVKKRSETKEMKNKIKVFENEKVELENNFNLIQAEIQGLKESNDKLNAQNLQLQERNNEQVEIISKLNEEINEKDTIIKEQIVEDAGSDLDDEKSKALSE